MIVVAVVLVAFDVVPFTVAFAVVVLGTNLFSFGRLTKQRLSGHFCGQYMGCTSRLVIAGEDWIYMDIHHWVMAVSH